MTQTLIDVQTLEGLSKYTVDEIRQSVAEAQADGLDIFEEDLVELFMNGIVAVTSYTLSELLDVYISYGMVDQDKVEAEDHGEQGTIISYVVDSDDKVMALIKQVSDCEYAFEVINEIETTL